MKKIAVLGSTGSIGTQTLEIVRHRTGFGCSLPCGAGSRRGKDGAANSGISPG